MRVCYVITPYIMSGIQSFPLVVVHKHCIAMFNFFLNFFYCVDYSNLKSRFQIQFQLKHVCLLL